VPDIRECRDTDIGLLETRMPTGGHDAHGRHFARQVTGACTYLTAWQDGQPVGSALILWEGCHAPENRQAFPEAVEISQLQVHPDARSRGIGTALIAEAERRIADRGHELVTISVGIDNRRAAELYARLGYQDTGLRSTSRYNYRDAGGQTRLIVECDRTLAKHVGSGELPAAVWLPGVATTPAEPGSVRLDGTS
jgi:ribosomal protein S18 acetylase RimI-like enzyme